MTTIYGKPARVMGPAAEADIQALEQELSVSLPSDYRAFVAENGAGIVGKVEVYGLGAVKPGPPNLRWLLAGLPARGFVRPRALVPFAELGNGDLIAVLCEPFEGYPRGAAVYWAPRPSGTYELAPAAASFQEYVTGAQK